MTRAIFVSGTDTDVGKTVVSALLCRLFIERGLTVGYYKPVQSGAIASPTQPASWLSPDCQLVSSIAPQTRIRCSYTLPLPAAPQLAAELHTSPTTIEWQTIDREFQTLRESCDITIVEGAGGLAVPLANELAITDLVQRWTLPLALVSRPHLGTINHTSLSIAYCQQLRIPVEAVIMAYNSEDLDPSDPILATAPRFIQQIIGKLPIYQLPYIQLPITTAASHWQKALEALTPAADVLFTKASKS